MGWGSDCFGFFGEERLCVLEEVVDGVAVFVEIGVGGDVDWLGGVVVFVELDVGCECGVELGGEVGVFVEEEVEVGGLEDFGEQGVG